VISRPCVQLRVQLCAAGMAAATRSRSCMSRKAVLGGLSPKDNRRGSAAAPATSCGGLKAALPSIADHGSTEGLREPAGSGGSEAGVSWMRRTSSSAYGAQRPTQKRARNLAIVRAQPNLPAVRCTQLAISVAGRRHTGSKALSSRRAHRRSLNAASRRLHARRDLPRGESSPQGRLGSNQRATWTPVCRYTLATHGRAKSPGTLPTTRRTSE